MTLVEYNAERCEKAKPGSPCRCHCGGEFHGKKHSAEWIRERERELDEQLALDLPERAAAR